MKSDYAYDGAGHITSINHQQRRRTTSSWPAYTPLVAFGYGYDNAGRINAQVTDWNTSLAAFTYRTDEGQAFTYDAAGQLAGVSSNVYGQATYGYTPGGNRSSTTEPGFGTHVYTPGPQNRVAVTDHTGSAIDYSYVYDNEGNVTERRFLSNNALDQRYTWDHRNRLVKVENFDLAGAVAQTIDYRYNAAGDLVYRRDDELGFSEQEHYVVEAGARTMTIEPDGDLKRRYLHGPTDELLFD